MRRPPASERPRAGYPGPQRASAAGRRASEKRRLIGLLAVCTVVLGAICVRLVEVQGLGRERFAQLGLDQRLQVIELAAERGAIFDRNGNDLAVSVRQQTVWADPRVVGDPVAYAAQLAPVVGVAEADLVTRLAQRDRAFVYVARKVDDATATRVRALRLPGVGFVPESERFYPSSGLAGPVLGFVGTDNNGLAGLEYAYEDVLSGRPGEMVVERDPRGHQIPDGERRVEPSRRGADLVVTIDQALQYEVERVLVEEVVSARAKGGTAAVVDVQTGDVLAMATVEGATADHQARPAPAHVPNRALTDVYEPGSTNKVITVAGALEAGTVAPDTPFQVPNELTVDDQVFEDVVDHPPAMTVSDIVRLSSNVGTILIARTLGNERFDSYVHAFGFGSPTGLRFPGESSGIVLPLSEYNDTSLASMPVGSGIAVTAMQMLDVFTTIATGGVSRPPRLVTATIGPHGQRRDEPAPPARRVVTAETAAAMRTMLESVVAGGTGTRAAVPGYDVAGKTGTARKPPYDGGYIASFAGFAPADTPRLAAIVVLDEPRTSIYGGQVAAPAFSRIMQFALRLERVPPTGGGTTPPGTLSPSP